jgi:hypothetical protein
MNRARIVSNRVGAGSGESTTGTVVIRKSPLVAES